MAFEYEQRQARRLMDAIEGGTMTPRETWTLIQEADPTLVYFIVTWIRSRYGSDRAGEAIIGRIVTLFQAHPQAAQVVKEGGDDPIVEWFEEEYDYSDFSASLFIETIVEKLEG